MRTDYHSDFLPEPGVMFLLDRAEIEFGDDPDRDTFKLWDGYFQPIAFAILQKGTQPREFELWQLIEGWSWEDSSHLIEDPRLTLTCLSELKEADFDCEYRADVDLCCRHLQSFLNSAVKAGRPIYIRRE